MTMKRTAASVRILALAAMGAAFGTAAAAQDVSNLPMFRSTWQEVIKPNAGFWSSGVAQEFAYSAGPNGVTSVAPPSTNLISNVRQVYGPAGEMTYFEILDGIRSVSFVRANGDTFTSIADGKATYARASDWTRQAIVGDPLTLGWRYQNFAAWQTGLGMANGSMGATSFGQETPWNGTTTPVPQTGSATFTGLMGGIYNDSVGQDHAVTADVGITMNYGAHTAEFYTVNTRNRNGVAYDDLNISGLFLGIPNYPQMFGSLRTARLSGTSSARFFGPQGEEFGGVFTLTPTTGIGLERLAGAFGSKLGIPVPPPTPRWNEKLTTGAAVAVAGKAQEISYVGSRFFVSSVGTPSAVNGAVVTQTYGAAGAPVGFSLVSGDRSISFSAVNGDTFNAPGNGSQGLVVALSADGRQTAVIANPLQLGWNYQSLSVWQTGIPTDGFPQPPPGPGATGAVSYGEATGGGAIPTTASAVFRGRALASSLAQTSGVRLLEAKATLNVDFANRAVFLTTSTFLPVDGQNVGGVSGLVGVLTYSPGTNALSGTVNTLDARLTGSGTAQFYGPGANEAGGTFFLTYPSADAIERLIGAFGVTRAETYTPGAPFASWAVSRLPGATVAVSGQSQEMTLTREGFNVTSASNPSSVGAVTVTDTFDANGHRSALQIATANRTVGFSRGAGDTVPQSGIGYASADRNTIANSQDAVTQGFDYQSFGAWQTGANSQPTSNLGVFSVGAATPGSAIPTSGAATFTGQASNVWRQSANAVNLITQTMTLTANFADRTADLMVNPLTIPLGGGSSARFAGVNGRLTYAAGSNQLSGAVTTTDGLMSGTAAARFYGPQAQEVGGLYGLTAVNGGALSGSLLGSFGARR